MTDIDDEGRALLEEALEGARLEQIQRERIRKYLGLDVVETQDWTRAQYERALTARLEKDLR